MTQLRGRIPTAGGGRWAHLREWRHESLWLWPAVAVIGAWVLGALAAAHLGRFDFHQGLFPTDLDDSRTLLATIAAALLTFTGVVFSITLVALQMASTQYSPRVLRTFVRKPVTKLALSTFLATFVYALTLLARVGTTTKAHTVSQGAVGLAFLLVVASLLVFVVFVHSTVRSMRVSYVITAVFRETLAAVQAAFEPDAAYHPVEEPAWRPDPVRVQFARADAALDGVDTVHLVDLARHHACVVRLLFPVGTFVARGTDLFEIHGGSVPPAGELLAALDCSPVRTLYQDPCYGLRQLVDIAIRALSPAVNDPTTAVQSLDRIHAVLRAVSDRPDPSGVFVDGQRAVRVVVPIPGWDRLVELAFTEVEVYGVSSPQITRKLVSIFDDLTACVGPERAVVLAQHRSRLRHEVGLRHTLSLNEMLTPDRLGLG